MLEIVHVFPGSTAARLDLQSGDLLISVNGQEVNDTIDFQFLAAEELITLVIRKRDGSTKKIRFRKHPDDYLGLDFPPLRIKRCRNHCIFCFVDQMPAGCRKTLYVKDDDFRASFLYGNFITLSSLSESDWDRIFRQRLSPLYISVHATEIELRSSILRNKKAPPVMESLKRLAAGGIRMHTQIVLSPGVNDGEHLTRTIKDLSGLHPWVSSVAVVPVGMTAFRKNLFPLRSFSRAEAHHVVQTIELLGRQFKKGMGTRLVFPSDEFYIKAGEKIPSASFYEDFPQLENGVGMVARFLREVASVRLPSSIQPVSATVVTGVSFSNVLGNIVSRLSSISGLRVRQITVKNRFFGPSVTVTGLLAGGDIVHALKGRRLGDMVLIPSNTLKDDGPVFLDGTSLKQVEDRLQVPIFKIDGFKDMIDIFRSKGRRRE